MGYRVKTKIELADFSFYVIPQLGACSQEEVEEAVKSLVAKPFSSRASHVKIYAHIILAPNFVLRHFLGAAILAAEKHLA